MRADARRNLEKLESAAVEVFRECGLGAPLEDIAERAGVSIGTLYNHFGSRQKLIDSVVPEVAAAKLCDAMNRARQQPSAWRRFVVYIKEMCALQAADTALNDIIARSYEDAAGLTALCDESVAFGTCLIAEAQADGSLRDDITPDDIFVLFWLNAHLTRTTGSLAPEAWKRHVAIMLDGLQAAAANPLPVGPDAVTPAVPTLIAGT